jgi:hypothetical protein
LMCKLLWNKSTLIVKFLFPEKDLASGYKIQGFLNFSVLSIFRKNQESIKAAKNQLAFMPPAISARDFLMLDFCYSWQFITVPGLIADCSST